MMSDDEIVVRLMDMPVAVKGFVSPSPDGVYNIYINARQASNIQCETYRHELSHIENCDFESDEPITEIET